MNVVFIMTDTQNRDLVGAYGNPRVDTPNLDRLAASGVRFDHAYTTCPLCTPARGALFSGLYPQVNGAYCNNVAPHSHVSLLGTIMRKHGFRAGYTGKWHLDGSAYFGDGEPGGGFEPDWWYDGKRYAEDIGPEMFDTYRTAKTPNELRAAGFDESTMWAHRVADRAEDFLKRVGDEPFYLAVSFDEPHGPFVAPPEYWEKFSGEEIPEPENYFAPVEGKPELAAVHRREHIGRLGDAVPNWHDFVSQPRHLRWLGCNSYVDREIGRVIDAVDALHGEDTMIIYTSDHGDHFGSHGLVGKGPAMYRETTNIPFIVRLPGGALPSGAAGAVSSSVVSHIDVVPTILDFAGGELPELLNGTSLRPILESPSKPARHAVLVSFHRFAINHDSYGEFYPVRCATDGRYKLVVNLFETDELYDLATDPGEMENRIDDSALAAERNRLHDWMLEEMDRVRDPFRSCRWANRSWRTVREVHYAGLPSRAKPEGFSFEPKSI